MIQAGDIIAFCGYTLLSDFINVVTLGKPHWNASHVGIMANLDGRLLLFESTTLDKLPDELTGTCLNGTQVHDLAKVLDGYKGKVWHYALAKGLTPGQSKTLTKFLMTTLHKPYDTLGAMRSAWLGLPGAIDYTREDLKKIFCSEWCMAALKSIGKYESMNPSAWNPNRMLKELLRHGVVKKPVRLK